MTVQFLLERFRQYDNREAMVWRGQSYSYSWLRERTVVCAKALGEKKVQGAVVALEGDYTPDTLAALLALLELGAIVVPIDAKLVERRKQEFKQTSGAAWLVDCTQDPVAAVSLEPYPQGAEAAVATDPSEGYQLLEGLRDEGAAGIIIFTSGSTGKSKAAVHHAGRLLDKFRQERPAKRTIPFMMFDHIGGLNTMLQTVAGGGCLIVAEERAPAEICRLIAAHQVQALPVSPTFLNLLLLSRAYETYSLDSLEVVSYGSEVMPPSTLAAWHRQFPHVKVVQAYGMSEIGVLSTKSKASDSLYFKLGDGNVQYRIVDGKLELRSPGAMLGYLNAPSPFTADGWLQTGDLVIQDGEYIQVLGRASDLINVGGEKVFPAEVESVLQQLDNIEEVAVSGVPNAITGHMVKARVKLKTEEPLKELRLRIHSYCKDKLPPYKIPQRVEISAVSLTNDRLKKVRN